VVAALLAGLWHASPVLLWNLRLEDQLRRQGDPARLRSPRERLATGVRAGWSQVVTGEIALRAPVAAPERARCRECAERCRLRLAGGGTLAIFDSPPPESYREMLDRFAPDAADLSLLRSVAANWRTIDALTDRVRVTPAPPPSFRFAAEGSQGVVTEFQVGETLRYVIYAYGHDGFPARVVGLTGIKREQLLAVLGELRVEGDQRERSAVCSSISAPRPARGDVFARAPEGP
jgi:hypothetical protein